MASEARASDDYPSGYSAMHPLPLKVRADMLESVAGLDAEGVEREIAFALGGMTDPQDPATLRWLACLCDRRISDLEGVRS